MTQPTAPDTYLPLALLAALLPHAARDEILADVKAEFVWRSTERGRVHARIWLWRQVWGSLPLLFRHAIWRGWSGFEPRANRMRSGGPGMESWIMDARYAMRRLVKRPTYAALAVGTLALGVGGTAAVYGIVRELLLSPLPIAAEAEVAVWWKPRNWSEEEHLFLRGQGVPGFRSVASYGQEDVRLSGDGGMRVVPAVRTSAELFEVLGVRPQMGPGFVAGDDVDGAELKVVLSHGLWADLGSDPGVVGTRIELNGVMRTVAGVMPRGFWFPSPDTRAWVAYPFDPNDGAGWYTMIGRLEPGMTEGAVRASLDAITTSLGAQFEYSEAYDNSRDAALTPVREHILGSSRAPLVATLVAMAVILLIACANVAALMLGQMEGRATELSVRRALGAGRRRLTQQLLLEGGAVGVAAGIAGAAFAAVSFRLLLAALPLGALAERATLDWSVFWFSMGLAVAAALAIALIPVVGVVRSDLRGALTSGRTGGIAGRGGRMENGLVVAEVALAVVIAAGAAVLIRSVGNLRAIETGINVEGVAVLDIVAPTEVTHAERRALVMELVDAVRTLPGVEQAGAVQRLPLRGSGDNWGLGIEGRPDVTGTTTIFRIVSPEYFGVMGARLRSGRLFDSTDRADTEMVIVINEALARTYFPDEDPIGRRIAAFGDFARIVGVVADIRESDLTSGAQPARYMLQSQLPYSPAGGVLVMRATPGHDPAALLGPARDLVRRTAPGVGIQDATTMERVLDRALGPAKQLMSLLTLLAGLALVLGGVGVYGVVSHFVTRRKRDWAIRMALGFRPRQVVGHVVGRGTALVTAGAAIGAGAAVLVTRVLDAFVYGVGTADPAALGAAALTLIAVGVLSALVPARRASRVDPARALREQ